MCMAALWMAGTAGLCLGCESQLGGRVAVEDLCWCGGCGGTVVAGAGGGGVLEAVAQKELEGMGALRCRTARASSGWP